MWVYLGLFLLAFGIWQAFQQGSLSPLISSIGMLLGIVIIFLSSWKFGLALLCILALYALVAQIIGNDKKKIQRIIVAYRDLKKQYPSETEDVLCRKLIAYRLYVTRTTNPKGINTMDEAGEYVKRVFTTPVTLKSTCHWIVSMEKGGSLKNANTQKGMDRLMENGAKLDKIIDGYIKKYL